MDWLSTTTTKKIRYCNCEVDDFRHQFFTLNLSKIGSDTILGIGFKLNSTSQNWFIR